jgi:hypothetical protein
MKDEIRLVRVPINTHCVDPNCKKSLSFGSWAYYYADSEEAVCPECGVKRGWSSKERVNQIIKELELREDIKALKKQRKIETDALYLVREKIDLHRLGERDLELEKQILKLTSTVEDYLRKCATSEEKEILQNVLRVIRETQDLQKEVREQVQSRLFLLERTEFRRKKKGLIPSEIPPELSQED